MYREKFPYRRSNIRNNIGKSGGRYDVSDGVY
jgi:hypothetical protein